MKREVLIRAWAHHESPHGMLNVTFGAGGHVHYVHKDHEVSPADIAPATRQAYLRAAGKLDAATSAAVQAMDASMAALDRAERAEAARLEYLGLRDGEGLLKVYEVRRDGDGSLICRFRSDRGHLTSRIFPHPHDVLISPGAAAQDVEDVAGAIMGAMAEAEPEAALVDAPTAAELIAADAEPEDFVAMATVASHDVFGVPDGGVADEPTRDDPLSMKLARDARSKAHAYWNDPSADTLADLREALALLG